MGTKSSREKRVERFIVSFDQLKKDVNALNDMLPIFPHPRTKEILHFRIWTKLDAAARKRPIWRVRDNVIVSGCRQPPTLSKEERQTFSHMQADSTRVLRLHEFYDLFLFINENVHVVSHLLRSRGEVESSVPSLGRLVSQDEEKTCSICLEAQTQMVLPCLHAFCEKCISDWEMKDHTCPLCRRHTDLDSDETWVLHHEFTAEEVEEQLHAITTQPFKRLDRLPKFDRGVAHSDTTAAKPKAE